MALQKGWLDAGESGLEGGRMENGECNSTDRLAFPLLIARLAKNKRLFTAAIFLETYHRAERGITQSPQPPTKGHPPACCS